MMTWALRPHGVRTRGKKASGIRFVGAEAWQCCPQLRTVKMPVSVASIADNAFRGCQLLTSVTVPGGSLAPVLWHSY